MPKNPRCSWVDMARIRQSLSGGRRGDQARLRQMRCISKATVSQWALVCRVMGALEGEVQLAELSAFQPSHAVELARHLRRTHGRGWGGEAREQVAEWVERCEAGRWTVQQLRRALAAERLAATPGAGAQAIRLGAGAAGETAGAAVADLAGLVASGRRFGCIYADPPWRYDNRVTRAAAENHYATMALEELATLPVGELAAERSHLHLWTTKPFAREGLDLLAAWGFAYKSMLFWVKPQLGIGNYWRSSTEILLLGVRGDLAFPPNDIKDWLEHPRTEHSAKPEAVRKLIERVSPGPYLELFARSAAPGWTAWGDQAATRRPAPLAVPAESGELRQAA